MSIVINLENDLLDREDLTIYEKTVHIVIARYVNGENKAFPSYETIAKKGSMAKVQAMRVVKSLIQKGLLKKEARNNKDIAASLLYAAELVEEEKIYKIGV